MALNRRRHDKLWKKVRLDRVLKLLPVDVHPDTFLAALTVDSRVKLNSVQDDDGVLHPAVQLRFESYRAVLKGVGTGPRQGHEFETPLREPDRRTIQ